MPFSANPAEWQFFDSESSTALLPKVQHALQSSSGVAIVTGPEGVGKTVLLNHLQATLSRQGQVIILPGTSLRSTEDLYYCIQRSLRTVDGKAVSVGSGRWEIVERLQKSAEFWGPIGLLVDDAHLLGKELFTELQFLLEQRSGSQALCRILLAGSHALEETLALPELSGFAQRIRTYTFLQPLRLAESIEYLKSRLANAGGVLADCFASDAVEAIVEAADGNPRCLNLLADESLLLSCHENHNRVTLETVQAALSSLQHLPHAWNISVSNHSDATLDDTVQNSTSWQSSSDGVIEIGAPQESGCIEIGGEPAVSQKIDRSTEVPDPTEESVLVENDQADELMEDLPSLDDLSSDPWLAQSDDGGASAQPSDETEAGTISGDSEQTFDAGYLLAELESVGNPAVEIDGDLDERLLRVAEAAVDDGLDDDRPTRPLEDMLQGFQQWKPTGAWPAQWARQSDLIRHVIQLEEPAVNIQGKLSVPDDVSEMSLPVNRYEINIPNFDEPVPVWPPVSAGVRPGNPVPVTVLSTSASHDSAPESAGPESPQKQTDWQEEEHNAWSDGQLLNDLDNTDSDQQRLDEREYVDASEQNESIVRLRIAGLEDSSSDVDADDADRDGITEPAPVPDQMFTLPIALEDVTKESAPLSHSVRLPSDELNHFHGPTRPGTTPTAEIAHEPDSPQPPISNSDVDVMVTRHQESIVECDKTDTSLLIRPQLISQAPHVASTVAAVQQLKPAAGTENRVISQSVRAALSVTPWGLAEERLTDNSVSEAAESQSTPSGFHNLFTRLRKRTSHASHGKTN